LAGKAAVFVTCPATGKDAGITTRRDGRLLQQLFLGGISMASGLPHGDGVEFEDTANDCDTTRIDAKPPAVWEVVGAEGAALWIYSAVLGAWAWGISLTEANISSAAVIISTSVVAVLIGGLSAWLGRMVQLHELCGKLDNEVMKGRNFVGEKATELRGRGVKPSERIESTHAKAVANSVCRASSAY
jgi:hypothetical protein